MSSKRQGSLKSFFSSPQNNKQILFNNFGSPGGQLSFFFDLVGGRVYLENQRLFLTGTASVVSGTIETRGNHGELL